MNESVVVLGQDLKMWQTELDNSNALELNREEKFYVWVARDRGITVGTD